MAYFAQLNEDNVVINVLSVENYILEDENGIEVEQKGIDFLVEVLGEGNFVQTSYNNNIRKRYAGIGFTYDPENDVFIPEKPFPSWVLNEEFTWESPIMRPHDVDKKYTWDENSLSWKEYEL